MEQVFGVDLSEWQAGISFDRMVAEGVKFVILRGGDGAYVDQQFQTFYEEAMARRMPVGAYWYSRCVTTSQAVEEAQFFYDRIIKGRKFELPVYMDVESAAQMALGKAALTKVVQAFCRRLEQLGCFVGIYTSASRAQTNLDLAELSDFSLWIAQWSRTEPSIRHGMWQYGGSVNYLRDKYVAGMVVDQDFMSIDYPSIIRAGGFNGFEKEEIDMTRAEVERLIDERIDAILSGRGTVPSDWAKTLMAEAVEAGITDGNRPQGYATREEAAVMALRALKRER